MSGPAWVEAAYHRAVVDTYAETLLPALPIDAPLLAHLARWQRQEGNRCELWSQLIDLQRQRIRRMLKRMPSLNSVVEDPEFLQDAWLDALIKVVGENACYDLPETSPWSLEQALEQDFLPD